MKITIFSNFLNHHQIPVCEEFYKIYNEDFRFVSLDTVPESRTKMGYVFKEYPYELKVNSNSRKEEAMRLAISSDVCIYGGYCYDYYINRVSLNKLTFVYNERILKNSNRSMFSVLSFYNMYKFYGQYNNNNLYLLSASAYAPFDFNYYNCFKGKTLKWGYFPRTSNKKIENLIKINKTIRILWVGRMLRWKHLEDAIIAVKKLDVTYEFNIVGSGEMYDSLVKSSDSQIRFLGNKSIEETRALMENSDIYLFTSDFNEGWGAVLNEAMSSGCACIASYKAGATPWLINNETGIIYDGTREDLTNKLKHLVSDRAKIEQLKINAYNLIMNTWNAKDAVNNFLAFVNNKEVLVGPMSKAKPISNNKMKRLLCDEK